MKSDNVLINSKWFLTKNFLIFFVIGAIIGKVVALIGNFAMKDIVIMIICGLYSGIFIGIYGGIMYLYRET